MSEWKALRKLDEETPRAYATFLAYVDMGPLRSLSALQARLQSETEGKPTTRRKFPVPNIQTLEEWSAKFQWQKRLGDYLEELAMSQADRQRERLEFFNEDIWQGYLKLREHVAGMVAQFDNLKVTKRRRVSRPDNPDEEMEIVTMRANVRDLSELVRAFGQLGKDLRAQLGLPTAVDITSGGQALKAYVTISPDDWDEPGASPGDVQPAPLAGEDLAE